MDPLPSVKTAFSIISREESLQRNASLSSDSQPVSKSQPSAFNSKFNNKFSGNKSKGPVVQCKNCGLKGHTIEKCYKLIGYPKDFKPRSDTNQKNQVKNFNVNSSIIASGSSEPGESEFHQLTKDQYAKFLSLIGEKQCNEEASVNANMAGTCLFNVCNSTFNSNKWIVDSGVNRHMIASESLLYDTVDVSKLNLLVSHPNGTSAKIEKIGNLNISNSLTLFDVFVVPEFNVNLLSVHKVCKDNKCEAVFNEHSCKIQDLHSKEMVGNGNESGGLYYVDSVPSGNSFRSNSTVCCVSKLTWHNRLGHPSDQALNSLKTHLNFGNESLPPCDVFHKEKQARNSFPASQHVTSCLGELINLDQVHGYMLPRVFNVETELISQ